MLQRKLPPDATLWWERPSAASSTITARARTRCGATSCRTEELTTGVILSASQSVRSMFQTPDVVDYLGRFLDAERERTGRGSA